MEADRKVKSSLLIPAHSTGHAEYSSVRHACYPRWVADLRNPTARDHLWHPAARSVYTNAPSAVVNVNVNNLLAISESDFDNSGEPGQ